MRINKVSNNSSLDTYFETMSRVNKNRAMVKTAISFGWIGRMLGFSDEAADVARVGGEIVDATGDGARLTDAVTTGGRIGHTAADVAASRPTQALLDLFKADGWTRFMNQADILSGAGRMDENTLRALLSAHLKTGDDVDIVLDLLKAEPASITQEMVDAAMSARRGLVPVVQEGGQVIETALTLSPAQRLDLGTQWLRSIENGDPSEFIRILEAGGATDEMLDGARRLIGATQETQGFTRGLLEANQATANIGPDVLRTLDQTNADSFIQGFLRGSQEASEQAARHFDDLTEQVRILKEQGVLSSEAISGLQRQVEALQAAIKTGAENQAKAISEVREALRARGVPADEIRRILDPEIAKLQAMLGRGTSAAEKASGLGLLGRRMLTLSWAGTLLKGAAGLAIVGAVGYGANRLWNSMTGGGGGPGGETPGTYQPRPRDPAVTAAVEAARTGDTNAINQALSTATPDGALAMSVARYYRKRFAIRLPGEFQGFQWAFVDQTGPDSPRVVTNVARAFGSLNNRRSGAPAMWATYQAKVGGSDERGRNFGTPQHAFNNLMEDLIGGGAGGRGLFGGHGRSRRRTRRMAVRPDEFNPNSAGGAAPGRRERRRMFRRNSENETLRGESLMKYAEIAIENSQDRTSALRSFAEYSARPSEGNNRKYSRKERLSLMIKEFSNDSTNNHTNNDLILFKEADEMSKSYYKDAVTDLDNTDKTLRTYFTGLGRLYDEKSETPKGDYKTLYNVHDETGADLVHAAHPKAIVLLDSIGNGGLVENGLEQKRQTHGVALSTPTGNYRANYASANNSLKK